MRTLYAATSPKSTKQRQETSLDVRGFRYFGETWKSLLFATSHCASWAKEGWGPYGSLSA
jgi:hypothetical protein